MFKKILIPFIIILVVIGGYFAFQKFTENKVVPATGKPEEKETKEVSYDDYEEDGPIFTDIPIDKVWEFSFDKELDSNTINEETIKVFDAKSQEEVSVNSELAPGGKKIIIQPPTEGYSKGATYLLKTNELKYVDGSPVQTQYQSEFITTADEMEEGSLNKELIFIEKEHVKSIEGNTIKLSNGIDEELEKGRIIIVPTDEEPEGQAYKINEIDSGIASTEVKVSQPEFSELFEELNIYKTYEIQPEHIQLEEGIEGISIESFAGVPLNTMVAAENTENENTGNGEFELPKVKMDFTKGFKFSFEEFQLGKGNQKAFLNGALSFENPEVTPYVKLKTLKIDRFNVTLKSQQTHDFKVTLPAVNKEKETIIYEDKTKKKLKKISERVKIANVNIPTTVGGVFVQGSLYLKANYNFSYQPEVSITFEFEDERGVVYDGKDVKPVKRTDTDIDVSVKGSGKVESTLGAAASMGVTAYGILGAGVEAFGGGKTTGEFFNGNNNDYGNYFCLKGSGGAVVEGSIFVDVVKARMVEMTFAELEIPPKMELGNCEVFESLQIDAEKIKIKAGETIELNVEGKYTDLSTQKSQSKKLNDFNKLTVKSSDIGAVEVKKKKNKLIITAPSFPTSDKASITVHYGEKGEMFEEPITSKVEIPINVTEETKKLTNLEIQKIMGKFKEIEKVVLETQEKTTLTDEEWSNSKLAGAKVSKMLPSSLSDIASKNMLEEVIPKRISGWFEASGEGGFFPEVYFDSRMKVIESTPNKIVVKTFQLEGISYLSSLNVYVTAIKENDRWVIDSYDATSTDEELLNITKEEFISYIENSMDSNIEFLGEETITSTLRYEQGTKTGKAYVIKDVQYGNGWAYFVDTGQVVFVQQDEIKDAKPAIEPKPEEIGSDKEEDLQKAIVIVKELYPENKVDYVYYYFPTVSKLGEHSFRVYENTDEGYLIEMSQFTVHTNSGEIEDRPEVNWELEHGVEVQ